MAATLPLFLNAGNKPKIIGTEIGPNKAANQVTIKPKIPPKLLAFNPTRIVIKVKQNVQILAKRF